MINVKYKNELDKVNHNDCILKVSNISKHFIGVQALNNVQMDVRYSEVHAVVGENGAGKTTLMNILGGIIKKDQGEVIFQNKKVDFDTPMESINSGIAIIHQELSMLPSLNIIENVFFLLYPTNPLEIKDIIAIIIT